jgi:hypothetical protein
MIYRTVKIFTGLPFKTIAAMKYKDLQEIVGILTTTLQTESAFENRFKINNVEFGFIPNFDDIKAKEYFDLSEYNESTEDLHKLMAILFRPIKDKDAFNNYSIVDYQGTTQWAEVMKQTPLNVVNGALGFFLTLSKELQIYTQRYLEKVKAEKETQPETILRNGDGTPQYINYQGVKDGCLNTSKT